MTRHLKQRGVSLLEALVAMTVMAIGAVAVVGLQATLRLNGDLAKQRAEGVRQAQLLLEEWRGYTGFTADAGSVDWADLVNTANVLNPADSNATYTRTVVVVPSGEADDNPRAKTVHVRVDWTDRANAPQTIALNTIISGVPPELGGSLSIPMSNALLSNPGGRHPAIPTAAVPFGEGTSRFTPPGAPSSLAWVFNNSNGVVTQVCTDFSDTATCTDITAMLLSGFVRFATSLTQPTPALAEAPVSLALPVAVGVIQTAPFNTTVPCYVGLVEPIATSYFCLLRVNPPSFPGWTGTTTLSGIALASDIDDDDDDEFKVCRYTTVRSNSAVVPTDLKNEDHPFQYVNAATSLTNQNYLVIRAGDDSNSFSCPDDESLTPHINGATWHHQPAS